MLSHRAALFAVVVAFLVGLVASLALRPANTNQARSNTTDPAASTERVRWKVPVAFGTNLPALGDNVLFVADTLKQLSNGALVLEVYEPGEIVPPFDITPAVHEGKVPAGYTWVGYDQGKIPASPLISAVPFGMEPWEFTAWWYDGGGRALGEALYQEHGVHLILCGLVGPETAGWFREPFESVEDVAGLKIRFAGLGGRALEAMGASVTMLPGGEIFQALEKGAIDATEFSLPVVDQTLGFDRVAKINYFPGWHQTFTASHLIVNQQTWQSLSQPDQAAIETACTAGVTRNLARGEALEGAVIAGFADKGVDARRVPLELLRQLNAVTDRVIAEEAAKDAHFAKILASQQAFMATYQRWKQLAYLPRDFGLQN